MQKYPRWKYIVLIIVVVGGLLYSVPNLFGEEEAVQVSTESGVPVEAALTPKIEQILTDNKIPYQSIQNEAEYNALLIRFPNVENQFKAQSLLKKELGENYTVALNLAPATPRWLMAIGAEPMKLGLDLRGGVHFLMAVDVESMLQNRLRGEQRNMREELRSEGIRAGIFPTSANQIRLEFRNSAELNKALSTLERRFPDFVFTRGQKADINDLFAQISATALLEAQNNAIDQTMTILSNRINELGVAEPIVQRQGLDRIAVDLPGVQDTARAKQVLGGTATVEFHLVDVIHDANSANVPAGSLRYQYHGQPLILEPQVVLSGSSITGAASMTGENGGPVVSIRLGGGGEAMFYRITKENIGKPLSVLYVETKPITHTVDGKEVTTIERKEQVISVATIQSALPSKFEITGLNDSQMANNLALLLRAGALPAPMSIIEESTVGPTLGKDNINKGILSVVVGLSLIVIFMLAYYRFFGFAADLALVMNLIILVAVLSMLGATLTLPAIAGMVLTLGMAVDANVLIFERIREELRLGMSSQASIAAGFEKAFATIVDSNLTTLIAALALFALGSGAIKSFAITLIVGLLTSMFTAITGTRAVIQLRYGRRNVKKLSIGI